MGIGVYDFLMEFCFLTADARLSSHTPTAVPSSPCWTVLQKLGARMSPFNF